MKGRLKEFALKLFALTLAIVMSIPTNVYAIGSTKSNKKQMPTSIRIADNSEYQDEYVEETETSEEESDSIIFSETDRRAYKISQKASLNDDHDGIIYTIKVEKTKDTDHDPERKMTLSLATNKNQSLRNFNVKEVKDLSEDGAELSYSEEKNDKDDLKTFAITSGSVEKSIEYVLEAPIDKKALDTKKLYSFDMSLDIDGYNIDLQRVSYKFIEYENEDDPEVKELRLTSIKEKEDDLRQIAYIREDEDGKDDRVVYTDYIASRDKADEESKSLEKNKIEYKISLDNIKKEDAEIKLDYYKAGEKGFEIQREFSTNIPYQEKVDLDVPAGYLVKLSLVGKVDKKNTKIENYGVNGRAIKSPRFVKEEEKSVEDDEEAPEKAEAENKSKAEKEAEDKKDQEEKKAQEEKESQDKSKADENKKPEAEKEKATDKKAETEENKSANKEDKDTKETKAEDKSEEKNKSAEENKTEEAKEEKSEEASEESSENKAEDKKEENSSTKEEENTDKAGDKNQSSNKEEIKEEKNSATIEEKKEKKKEFDQLVEESKEEAKKDSTAKDEKKGLLDGVKSLFGQTDLQKADKELKKALADEKNGLEEIQNLLTSFGEKYKLTRADQAKLMDDNGPAIKKLIEKDADKNFNPQMLFAPLRAPEVSSLENKKFTISTRFDTSTVVGPIQAGQSFTIKLDDRLTVKDQKTLDPIVYNGKTIANPEYDKNTNSIVYTIAEPILDKLQIPLSIDVDYNVEKIKELDGDSPTHSIKNSITGIGVNGEVKLPETVVDNDGKVVNQIIEPGSKDVLEIVDQGKDYQVHMDVSGNPIVKDGELASIDWTVRFTSTKDLLDLGLISNATLVKGSGLSRYENITINGKPIRSEDITTNSIEGKLGIRESKNHTLKEHTKDVVISFQTPVFNKQQKYMIDFSILLKNIKKSGAVRLVFDKGYTDEQVKEKTSKRIGMNNRTTIMGEFTSEDSAKWTVTDGVSTGDANNGLPLATRDLTGSQKLYGSRMAVYGIDETTGKMVIKTVNPGTDGGINITGIPAKETNPSESQVPGTIAVYEYDTKLTDSNAGYSMGGVNINKYQDVKIKQTWAGIDSTKNMPAQGFVVQDENGKAISPEINVSEGEEGKSDREITIPAAKYWTIETEKTPEGQVVKEKKTNQKVVQKLPDDETIGGTTYSYKEKYNYLAQEDGAYLIYNVMAQSTQEKDADFTVLKFDSKDPKKKLSGAKFTLQNAKETIELVTDANGRASFSNVSPGTYTLIENKAPNGYKLDTSRKTITVSNDGKVSVSGDNIAMQGGKIETKLDHHQYYPSYPSYMNALHYGKIDGNGNIEFYIYLKPEANGTDGSTNKNTRLNLNVLGGTINSVEVLDVSPNASYSGYKTRSEVVTAMQQQTASTITGNNVINQNAANDITGTKDVTDSFTGKTGYQLKFPSARFTNDWGFLVKVKAKGSESTAVSYDWLTDNNRVKDESRIQESIGLSTSSQSGVNLNIGNEPFQKLPVEVTKITPDKSPLANATFRLKDSKGDTISDIKSGTDGKASFGELSPGNYTIEEISAPSGYQKSQVIFDVTVGEDGKVIYNARFKDGSGTPKNGVDYILEEIETGQEGGKATITGITQSMILQEKQNQPNDGRLGWTEGVWEAYGIESYRYKASFSIANASKGGLFKIQFDPNLDFRRYVYEIPDLKDAEGKVLAKPYFNYETNLLTYQFTDNIGSSAVNASLEIIGIIPDKYHATQTDKENGYNFRIVIDPDKATGTSNPTVSKPNLQTTQTNDKVLPVNIKTDYYAYDSSGGGGPLSSEYIYDIYKDKNGDTYLKAMTYYNPTGLSSGKRTLRFDWLSMNKPQPGLENYVANGLPAFGFQELEVYKVTDTPANKERLMPLSYGIRPDQDPRNYNLVYKNTNVDPNQGFRDQVGDHRITYDPSLLKDTERLLAYGHEKHPLEIDVPRVGNNDGYVIIQTFKVTDEQRFKNLWSAYYFSQGSRHTGSYQKGNANVAIGSETGQEIPKFYTERVKLFNKTYKPGQFQIEKLDEANRTEKLQGATFSLTDAEGHVIYRSSDADGIVDFTDIEPGTYTLEETRAPERYSKSTRKWSVTVYETGNVLIREIGITGTGSVVEGTDIKLTVTNKPVGEKFQVYKKNGKGEALQGAEFTIYDKDEKTVIAKGTSNANGIVDFKFADGKSLEEGQQYILKETKQPQGYKPIDKKWVLEVKDSKTKVYNYLASTDSTELKSFIAEDNVNWVDAKNRNTSGWSDYDNRWTGWTGNSKTAQYMGTRIIAINKTDKYAIQRYVINPEARKLGQTTASIHRQVPGDSNMTWYDGNAEYKVFELDKPVTGLISDLILTNYTTKDITDDVNKTAKPEDGRYGEPKRLNLTLPKTSKPIVIDVKVPYKEETGGVGTGMDWTVDNSNIYWKADYYESVQDIIVGDPTKAAAGDIKGSYISEGSLDVNNEKQKFQFKLRKVKASDNTKAIQGAVFKLTGPDPLTDERYMTTGTDGMITFAGLEAGTYKLEETQPAPGYEQAKTGWTVRITNDGKVYIKDNSKTANSDNSSVTVSTNSDTARNNLMRRLQMAGANTELEIGDTLADITNPLSAGTWEVVDSSRSEIPTEFKNNGNLSKITEINKTENRIRQRFIVNLDGKYNTNKNIKPAFEIYQEPDTGVYGAHKNNLTYSVKTLKEGSTINNPIVLKNATLGIQSSFKPKDNEPYRYRIILNQTISTPIMLEVEGPYDENNRVGLGINYHYNGWDKPENQWVAHYYNNESDVNTKYKITVDPTTNGSVNAPESAKVGEDITLTANPNDGSELDKLIVDEKDVTQDVNNNQYTFKMPSHDVNVKASFKEKTPDTFNITVNNPQEGGTITAKPTSATAGTPINLTVTPKEGFEIEGVTMNGEALKAGADGKYSFTMPAGGATVSATFKKIDETPDPAEGWKEITDGSAAQITNKQTGIELKVHKINNVNEGLEGANFTLKKYTDKNFTQVDGTFTGLTATSDAEGNVVFKYKEKIVKLKTGYYILEETKSPVGYKKQAAPWKLQVKEENGSLKIIQNGPENTAASFLSSNKVVAADNQKGSIKYKSIVKNIDPDSKTFVQRVYIDTRAYGKVVNVQITPKHKREEIDRAGEPPVTITEGVKTAYRSTYQITNPPADVDVDKVLNSYDLRDPNVRTVNTARWRPFDWGFDEDLLNLEPGVYYIDIEGYYDGSIVDRKVTNEVAIDSNFNFTEKDGKTPCKEPVLKDTSVRNDIPEGDLGKIDLHIDFYDGARQFQEAYNKGGTTFAYKYVPQGSYQHGATNIRNWIEQSVINQGYGTKQAEDFANKWANRKLPGQKYKNALSKKVKINSDDRNWLDTGIIYPPLENPVAHADTSVDISSLYTSDKAETVPQEGMSITNEREVYNITFSKHKMDGDDNTNRLEGAVFKLQKKEGSFWYDMDESYVSSAFNGYFGFRRLEPGTYRLLEVAPPEGYRALDGTLLEFVIKTIDPKGETFTKDGKTYDKESGLQVEVDKQTGTHKVVDPNTGKIVESANGYVTIESKRDNYLIPNVKDGENSTGKLVDFVTSATAKNIGKVRNEVPGKGSVTIKKVDENGNLILGKKNESGKLIGAKFKAIRLGAETDKDGKPVENAVYEGTVGEDGTLKFEGLPLGNYELREVESPNGYINTGHVWHFTVGGKGLDPYAEDNSPRTRNITDFIELTSSDMIVNRPYSGDTTQGKNEIRPHVGQSLQFTNEYNIKDGVKISSGDYFVLKLTDNMDLHGIREDKPTNLDLFADGIGTLAKADYNRQAGTITYTFTEAAEQYTITDFKNVISSHINLHRVKNSGYQYVGMSVGNDTSKHKKIYVNYIVSTEYDNDGYNFINMASKIVSFNSDTGEFVHYFYINRESEYDGKNLTFRYIPNQTVKNLQITTYDLYNTDDYWKEQSMPASFGVNENDRNLWRSGITQPKDVGANSETRTNLGKFPNNRAAIVKVTGWIDTNDLTQFKGNSALYYGYWTSDGRYDYWNVGRPGVYRWDRVYVFENESTAQANFELKITNPSNKVVFEKVNTDGQVLKPKLDESGNVVKGAKFTLEKNDGTIEQPSATWTAKSNPKFVDKDGKISYNNLDKGLYRLIENEAPEGYAKPEEAVAYFKVDESGKIYKQVTVPKEGGTGTSEIYQEVSETIPIKVVNNKAIEFVKVDADDNGKILPGAEFKILYKEQEDGKYGDYLVEGKQVTVTSEKDGKFSLNLSKDGYYALEETKAPNGYSKYQGYIKEFRLENGKIQTLEKDPLKASLTKGANGMISSEIIEVDKDKGTFKERLVINPDHTQWTFDKEDTLLQLDANNWNVSDQYRTIRVATLEKGKSVDDLKDTDFREANPRNQLYNTNPLIYSIPGLYKSTDYTQPEPTIANIVTEKALVVEITGTITDKAQAVDLKPEVYSRAFSKSIDLVNYKLDINNMSEGKGTYVDYESKDPIQVENTKVEYPFTGGPGVWIGFAIIGLAVMLGGVLIYTKKKKEPLS